jgi:aldehyde:ferredoxin oxidoreductase
VVTIGPAGENLVAFSVIENDYWRSAGRTGVGAVMGSKKIKAIAVWGSMKKNLAHHDLARHFASDFIKKYKDHAATKAFKTMGTPMMVDILNHVGAFPSRYWQQGKVPHVDMINAAALHERCKVVPSACLKCFMACGRRSTVLQGRHTGLTLEGPEYETIYVFGGLCLVNSIEEIVYLNDLCDRLGLDTITAGNLVAFTIEATLRGRSDAKISYGDVDAIAALIHDIAYRRGTGQILAHGIREAAAEWGLEELAIHVKGMEPAGYDPRILKGMALAYGTSDRGACHLRSTFYKLELSGMFDPEQIEGKAAVFADWEDRHILLDTFIFCRFYRDFYLWDEMSAVVKATMGLDLDEGELRACARAVANDTRLFNLREGLKPEDDKLPRRFYAESLPETGKIISEQQMEIMLREYYQARGWDEQGRPKAE